MLYKVEAFETYKYYDSEDDEYINQTRKHIFTVEASSPSEAMELAILEREKVSNSDTVGWEMGEIIPVAEEKKEDVCPHK